MVGETGLQSHENGQGAHPAPRQNWDMMDKVNIASTQNFNEGMF